MRVGRTRHDQSVRRIVKGIRVRCPYCNRPLDMTDYVRELVRRILVFLRKYGSVHIRGLGTFGTSVIPERRTFLLGKYRTVKSYMRFGFRSSSRARQFINTKRPENEDEEEPWLKAWW